MHFFRSVVSPQCNIIIPNCNYRLLFPYPYSHGLQLTSMACWMLNDVHSFNSYYSLLYVSFPIALWWWFLMWKLNCYLHSFHVVFHIYVAQELWLHQYKSARLWVIFKTPKFIIIKKKFFIATAHNSTEVLFWNCNSFVYIHCTNILFMRNTWLRKSLKGKTTMWNFKQW